jgi:hypothetical protein
MDIKEALAAEAVKIVTGARRAAYGRPEQNFERIARLWNAHLLNTGRAGDLTAIDVATFCRLIKEARLAETPDHRDSFVDILGYTLCQAELALPAVQSPPLVPSGDATQDAISPSWADAISQSWADAANADRKGGALQVGDEVFYICKLKGERHNGRVARILPPNAMSDGERRVYAWPENGWMPENRVERIA